MTLNPPDVKLKKCPICNGKVYNHYKTWLGHYIINCHPTCGISMMTTCSPGYNVKIEAFKRWNSRPKGVL